MTASGSNWSVSRFCWNSFNILQSINTKTSLWLVNLEKNFQTCSRKSHYLKSIWALCQQIAMIIWNKGCGKTTFTKIFLRYYCWWWSWHQEKVGCLMITHIYHLLVFAGYWVFKSQCCWGYGATTYVKPREVYSHKGSKWGDRGVGQCTFPWRSALWREGPQHTVDLSGWCQPFWSTWGHRDRIRRLAWEVQFVHGNYNTWSTFFFSCWNFSWNWDGNFATLPGLQIVLFTENVCLKWQFQGLPILC